MLNNLGDIARMIFNVFSVGFIGIIGFLWATGLLRKTISLFFGEMDDGEIEKFSLLSLCFGLIIGVYWMMRTLKDPVFFELVGRTYQPKAKMLTPFALAGVLFFYSKVVDSFKKHRLFWVVCTAYAAVFLLTGIAMKANLPEINHWAVNWIPGRFLGWLYYISVETLGGIIVGAVFWAFVASTTKTVSAKKGYSLIFVGGQAGNLIGPAFNFGYAKYIGNVNLIFITAGILMLIPMLMELYMKVIPAHLHESDDSGHKKKKTGALEGVRLIATKPYLMGVLVVSTVYEVVSTIVDYQFKYIAYDTFTGEQFTAFLSLYAMAQAFVALLFVMIGTGFFIRTFGVRKCLLGYPTMVGLAVLAIWKAPVLGTFFVAMMVVKAFSYALNNPIKELLYLPTSKDVKYKAKAFIDGFGGKGAKALGSGVTNLLTGNLSLLLNAGGLISLGIVAFWGVVALSLGTSYDKLIERKDIIE